jgi:ribosomal protein L34E
MEETPATQYLFSRGTPMYHLAKDNSESLCGLEVTRNPEHRRRLHDLQITDKKPERAFDALCGRCYRIVNGLPEPEIDWHSVRLHNELIEPFWP